MLIAYVAHDEILVCKRKDEPKLMDKWFAEGCGRDPCDYDRQEFTTVVQVSPRIDIYGD